MGVPADTVTILLNDWTIALNAEVPAITAGQIVSAVFYQVESVDDGFEDLLALGYSRYDAWRLLGTRLHAPVNITGGNPLRPPGGVL